MRIQVASDLHLERFYSFEVPPFLENIVAPKEDKVDVLVLAGDIWDFHNVGIALRFFAKHYPWVIYVPGNHEYYGKKFSFTYREQLPFNVIVMDQKWAKIDNKVFIGATLWSELSNPIDNRTIAERINCFYRIDGFNENSCIDRHKMDFQYIAEISRMKSPLDIVVVTHFSPSRNSIEPKYRGSLINPYFCNDLDWFIEHRQPKVWIHGHVHSCHDYMIGNTRVVANPFGYYLSEKEQNSEFVLKKYVDI